MKRTAIGAIAIYVATWIGIGIAYSLAWLTDFSALNDRKPL